MPTDFDDIITSEGRMYDPSEVVLIGAHLEPSERDGFEADPADGPRTQTAMERQQGLIKVQSDLVRSLLLICHPIEETQGSQIEVSTDPSLAVIYAYAYEGHPYRLPKPRIMVVDGPGEVYTGSKGQETGQRSKLFMWRMSKHNHSLSIEIESGSIDTLVLDANTPGNRSVTSYHSHMQLAHRGGRLT